MNMNPWSRIFWSLDFYLLTDIQIVLRHILRQMECKIRTGSCFCKRCYDKENWFPKDSVRKVGLKTQKIEFDVLIVQ